MIVRSELHIAQGIDIERREIAEMEKLLDTRIRESRGERPTITLDVSAFSKESVTAIVKLYESGGWKIKFAHGRDNDGDYVQKPILMLS